MDLYITIDAPNSWATFDAERGHLIDRGVADSLEDLNFDRPIERVMLVASGSKVSAHKAKVPGSSRKNAISAIPYVLEEELTDDIEDLHFSLQHWGGTNESDVLVVNDKVLQEWLEYFEQRGYNVKDVIPEYLLLPRHPGADITVAKVPSGDYLIRSDDHRGTLIDEHMFELWWQMQAKDKMVAINDEQMVRQLIEEGWENVQFWDIGGEFPDWIGHGGLKLINHPCLLQGKYDDTESNQTRFDYKMAVNIVLAGIGIYLGAMLLNYAYLEFKSTQLGSKARDIYQSAFPEFQNQSSEDPLYDMRKAMSALRNGTYQSDSFLAILQVVAGQLSNAPFTTVTNLVFEDNVLSAQVNVNDFATLDNLLQQLQAATQGVATVSAKDTVAQENQVSGVLEVIVTEG